MRKLIACVLLLLLVGCGSINKEFVAAVERSWDVIGPRYEAYIDADETLDEDTKKLRKMTSQTLAELIKEAKDE